MSNDVKPELRVEKDSIDIGMIGYMIRQRLSYNLSMQAHLPLQIKSIGNELRL
jgi:hypothetical protein